MRPLEKKTFLDNLMIAAPCSQSWDSMPGTDIVRHCGACDRSVYNISAMTNIEAENFLRKHGDSQCMRFYRRSDGTILTDNCPVALRQGRDNLTKLIKFAAGFVAVLVAAPAALTQTKDNGHCRLGQASFSPTSAQAVPSATVPNGGWLTGGVTARSFIVPPATEKHGDKNSNPIRLTATMHADRRALNLLMEAQKSEAAGKDLVALCYYRKALASIDPKKADWKFRSSVQAELEALEIKLGLKKR